MSADEIRQAVRFPGEVVEVGDRLDKYDLVDVIWLEAIRQGGTSAFADPNLIMLGKLDCLKMAEAVVRLLEEEG